MEARVLVSDKRVLLSTLAKEEMDIVPQKSIETLDPSNVANIDDTNGNESQRGSKDSFDPPSMTTGTRLAIEFCNRVRV